MAIKNLGEGEAAYLLLKGEYDYIRENSFVDVLRDGRGHGNRNAAALLIWILDWYSPRKKGGKRLHGPLVMWSEDVADELLMSVKQVERARHELASAGLVQFESRHHRAIVHVDWDAIDAALDVHRQRIECRKLSSRVPINGEPKSRVPINGDSKLSRVPVNGEPKRLESPLTGSPYTPLPTPLKNPPLGNGSAAAPAEGGQEEEEALKSSVESMLDYGRANGRRCDGSWADRAHAVVGEKVAEGYDIDLIGEAWRAYINAVGGSKASDLGHWVLGRGLNGKPRDEGENAFSVLYEKAAAKAEKKAEAARVAAGGVPGWAAHHLNGGGGGWLVSGGGTSFELGEMSKTDAIAEATRRWMAAHGGESQN